MDSSIRQYRRKARIRSFLQTLLPWKAQSFMVAALKYVPYLPKSDSYVIPKTPNPDLKVCSQGLRIPPDELTQGYGEEHIPTGERDVKKMLELLKATEFELLSENRVLEMGCATGRMIRHLKPFTETCEIWGTDIDAKFVYWCQQNLNPPFHFATTTTIPHMPFADGYFNLIYTGSVFTHIDDLAEAWFLELSRILSPGGRLYTTIADNNTVNVLETSTQRNYVWSRDIMSSYSIYNERKNDFGMLVVGRDTASQVFYDIDYLRKIIPSTLEILSVTNEAYGYQSAVIFGKRK
jgi:SAM-dependent methyltransferase